MAEPSIYDQLAEEEAGQRAAATGAAIRSVVGLNPDQHAKVLQLSRSTGIPPAVVSRNQDTIEAQAKAREAADLLARSPILARQIADRDFSTVAQDDVSTLAGIEKAIGGFTSYVMGARQGGGLPGLVASGARSAAAGFGPGLGANAYGAAAFPFEALGIDSVGGFLRNEQRAAGEVAKRVRGPAPADANIFERGILSGLESAGQSIATLPFGLAGSTSAMLGTMGGLTFGQSYGKARDQGASVMTSGLYAMEDATAEIVTEKFLGAGKLIGDAKAGMSTARLLMRDIAREVPGEMGATLWQNFNEWANLNPEKTLAEFVSEQPAALAETIIATVVGGGAQVGAIRGIQKALGQSEEVKATALRAEQFAAQVEGVNKLIAVSKTAARDAETVREFIAQVADEQGDAPTEFYVDGEVLLNTLNQSGITREELEAIAPIAAQQLDAALTGGMVRFPVSELLMAGEKISAPLVDHLRETENAPTRLEAAEILKTEGERFKADMEAELSKRDNVAQFRDGVAEVQNYFEGQLNDSGALVQKYGKSLARQANKAGAVMLSQFYGAKAAQLGMTPQELLDKYRLRVQSKVAQGERNLNQTLYRGVGGDSGGGNFFTADAEFARNFTRSGQDKEIVRAWIDDAAIHEPAALPEANNEQQMDAAIAEAKAAGKKAVRVSEGEGQPTSVFVFDKSAISRRGTYDPADPNILNQPAKPSPEAIELRKREAVLKSLLECVNG